MTNFKICQKCKNYQLHSIDATRKGGLASVCKKCRKTYYRQNKKRENENNKKYYSKRKKEDALFRLRTIIRIQTNKILRRKYNDHNTATELIGLTYKGFIEHLNDNIYGFKYGDEGIELDHIISLSTAKNEIDLIGLAHYSNIQLMPKEYNQNIKGSKVFNREHFENWLFRNSEMEYLKKVL